MKLAWLVPVAVIGCASGVPAPPPPTLEATVPAASSVAATAAPAIAAPTPSADRANDAIRCSTSGDGSAIDVRIDLGSMRGTVDIDGPTKRRFKVHAVPHAATYVLLFAGYAADDQRPPGEHLVAGRSVVTRYVTDLDDADLYFDGDVRAGGSAPRRCAR